MFSRISPHRLLLITAFFAALVIIMTASVYFPIAYFSGDKPFDGYRALRDVQHQVSLGPRTPGSPGHDQIRNWIQSELIEAGWSVQVQSLEYAGKTVHNVIAKRGQNTPWVIVGAHYDTRFFADRDADPSKQTQPVPGGNDGASGVAVLLELARTLPDDLDGEIWLVFFDAEDNGGIQGWQWIMGSTAFVDQLQGKPDKVVILDMIGDADLNIYYERNSDPDMSADIWRQASELGYGEQFIPEEKFSMLDDHTPFLEAGIPAVDIIDFDYPFWHTTDDTSDKVSAASLKAVGDTIRAWLIGIQ
jgi:glutaminyl-peptide cyclotransferase